MKAIICTNRAGYIGHNGRLPWSSKADMSHFRKMTLKSDKNQIPKLLVGYKTAQTLPPLKGRDIVIDDGSDIDLSDIDWCIGGGKTYEKYQKYFTELHISTIMDDDTVGDVKYPLLEGLNKECKIFHYYFKKD